MKFKFSEAFFVFMFCVIVFANAYTTFLHFSYEDALFSSIRVQTLSGSNIQPISREHKVLLSLHHIIAYMIVSGFLVFQFF
jgi:hypothetical protein